MADIADRLCQAGLPADNLLARRDALPAPVRQLHHRILSAIASTGSPPPGAQLSEWFQDLQIDGPRALQALADAELIFTAGGGVAVTGGVPFSAGNASAHRVQILGGPAVAANCAIDALGIPAMVGRDVDISSVDPSSGKAITLASRNGQWTWQPASAVVFVGSSGSGRLTEACCPVINFFADREAARAYQREHDLEGDVLTMPEAVQAGALVFGDLLDAAPNQGVRS